MTLSRDGTSHLDIVLGLVHHDVSRELVVVDVSLNPRVLLTWNTRTRLIGTRLPQVYSHLGSLVTYDVSAEVIEPVDG